MVAGQSIKRFVEPDEIADLCLFLASPAAKMVTGQAIGRRRPYRNLSHGIVRSAPWISPSPKNSR